ncbi:hypothetical protein AB0K18_07845 [Nonomuraea sp. NPDC049421]
MRIAEEIGRVLGRPYRYADLPVPEMAAHLETPTYLTDHIPAFSR